MNRSSFVLLMALLLHSGAVSVATEVADLPVLAADAQATPTTDYLIDPTPFEARASRNIEGSEIVLDNGLVRRTWRLAPNGACVGFDNLMNGQAMLRSVRPEARVTLDGVAYEVGGLIGQPNHAFLTPAWLDQMEANPKAMRLVGFEVGTPAERFAWGRRRHAAAGATWPPKGVYLRMDYGMPATSGDDSVASDFAREAIWVDPFSEVSDSWTIQASASHPRVSFENEGKPGEIYAPAGAHCFAERSLPADAALIEAAINPGTDTATSWGPGLAWVFERGTVKVNLRPGDRGTHGQFELRVNGRERLASVAAFDSGDGGLDVGKTYLLRMRLEDNKLIAEAAIKNDRSPVYQPLFEVRRSPAWGRSRALRVGRMDRNGAASDDGQATKQLVRLLVESAAAYGPLDEQAVERERASANGAAGDPSPVSVSVHYEMYDGVPVMSKWISVHNESDAVITVDRFRGEEIALVEHSNPVETRKGIVTPPPQYLHAETDFAAGGFNFDHANRHVVHWRPDPLYTTQVNYTRQQPSLLVCEPTNGPAQRVQPGDVFQGFRTFELVYGEEDRERRGLALRRMYRTVAPWVTENPITHHLLTNRPEAAREAIDKAAEVGFEAIIFSFGSGFNMENRDPSFLADWKEVADYAKSKDIELGTYSLFSSRGVGRVHMIKSPPGESPTHGQCPSPSSEWGRQWMKTVVDFYDKTGFAQFENDGPYPNDVDVTPRPPLHRGVADSRWVQFHAIAKMYRDLCGRGVFINQPDYYYLNGAQKCGMGYREVNWSLPRAHQLIHTRQNIYDGTWQKTPSMGWMFVPLTQYHGGGAAATIEPLNEHLDHYENMMRSNLGMGVQAHYRGPRLYDTPATRDMVESVVDWFKEYRDILESDIIHGRRADGRDLDWVLHANPQLDRKGMLCVYNPLDHEVTKKLRVDLYYTGLTDTATISREGREPTEYELARDYTVEVEVTVPAQGMTWSLIE